MTAPGQHQACTALSRRRLLSAGLVVGAAGPLGLAGAHALAAGRPAHAIAGMTADPICRAAASDTVAAPAIRGQAKTINLAWMPTALCMVQIPVALHRGFFEAEGLKVETVNWAGSTDLLLQAISTGKADAGVGMVLRWLKPLEQGFDVKITGGTHGGCMYILARPESGLDSIGTLRGKRIGVGDISGVDKNFFSIALHKVGISPDTGVEWKAFPPDTLGVALQKGEVDAISTSDPLAYSFRRTYGLTEVTNNQVGDFLHRSCCVVGVAGTMARNDKPTAAAITRALVNAAEWTYRNPDEAAVVFGPYAPKQKVEDLATMLRDYEHHHHPTGDDFRAELATYVQELKEVNVIGPKTDPQKFSHRIYADVLG